jgi:hypothetical protein
VPIDVPRPAPLENDRPRSLSIGGIASAVLGVALFAWYVRGVGPAQIWDGLRSIGWGFVPIIGIAGARFALRAISLMICVEPPYRLPFISAFTAVLAGDTLGNVTPLGLIASEPTKAAFLRRYAPLGTAVAAVAIETLLYSSTVAAMIAASTVALLLSVNLPPPMRNAALIAVAVIIAGFSCAAWLLWKRPAIIGRTLSSVAPVGSKVQRTASKIHDLEQQIYSFAVRRRHAVVQTLAVHAAFHALGVLEIYVTLLLILPAPVPILTAFMLEGANRLVQVVFKPVPLRAGVDEVTTGTFTAMLGYGPTLGATLAIVRKVRTVFWVLVGTLLLVKRGVARN